MVSAYCLCYGHNSKGPEQVHAVTRRLTKRHL